MARYEKMSVLNFSFSFSSGNRNFDENASMHVTRRSSRGRLRRNVQLSPFVHEQKISKYFESAVHTIFVINQDCAVE